MPRRQLAFGDQRFVERPLARQRRDGVQPATHRIEAVEEEFGQRGRGRLARPQQPTEFANRGEGEAVGIGRHRSVLPTRGKDEIRLLPIRQRIGRQRPRIRHDPLDLATHTRPPFIVQPISELRFRRRQ